MADALNKPASKTLKNARKTVVFASANDSESIKYSDNIDNMPIPG
jgi:hypothetical protein